MKMKFKFTFFEFRTINLWSDNGDCLQELHGHTAFIYSVRYVNNTGEIVSGSEDRTLKIWKGNNNEQSIMHPGSVWSVDVIKNNGDIITGCSDGTARIWTKNKSRF